MVNNITVHFQIHKNKIAVEECLKRFRLHFPTLPMYIHGDNGYDFSYLKEIYNNTEYKHWNESISPRGLSGGNWRGYLERILLTCKKYPNEWVLFLEEDVNTLHNNIIFPTSDFAGAYGHYLSDPLINYIKKLHPHLIDIGYNNSGGSLAKMDALVKSIESVLSGEIDMNEIGKMDNRVINYSDALISTILLLNGYSFGSWEQASQTVDQYYKENAIFDHGWKEFYDKDDWEEFVNKENINKMKDLVISAIANYMPEKIKIYVESLNDCGFYGDKVMICYNIPQETIDYLTEKGWKCFGAELEGHPHMNRLIDMWWFLQNDEREWRYIITTDVRDIVWQTNPSIWLEENLKTEILCASECVTYENEPWGQKNIHEGYGPMFWDWIKPNTIGNVGVIAGKYKSVKDLLMLNWLVSQSGDKRHFTDQSSFNLIIHNELIRDKISINSDFALQVGTNTNDLKIKNDTIMNGETPYVLVHQYDRNIQLNNLVIKKYE